VKSLLRNSGFLRIIVLLSFIAGYFSIGVFTAEQEFSRALEPGGNNQAVLLPSNLFCTTLPSGNNFKSQVQGPVSTPRNPFHQVIFCSKYAELIISGLFSEYHFYSKYLIVRFLPRDITFPFHYFW